MFLRAKSFRHKFISAGTTYFKTLLNTMNKKIDSSEFSTIFSNENLSKYNVIVFLNTTGSFLMKLQKSISKVY